MSWFCNFPSPSSPKLSPEISEKSPKRQYFLSESCWSCIRVKSLMFYSLILNPGSASYPLPPIYYLLPTVWLWTSYRTTLSLPYNVALRIKWEHANSKAFSTSLAHMIHSIKASIHVFLGGSKNTVDVDCSHEIKRCLLLGRKVMTNLGSILKIRDITFPIKVHPVKAMVFPVVMYGCESWTTKKA